MEIFDNHYFHINKSLLRCIGAWPYDSNRKIVMGFWFCVIVMTSIPHVISTVVNYSERKRLLENIVTVLHVYAMFAKLLTLTWYEKKVKVMYEITVDNWKITVDEEEKKILRKYSDRGRYYTILYSVFLTSIRISFVLFPLLPAALSKMKILSTPQPLIFVMNGEFLMDREAHYWKVYLFDCVTSLTILAIYTPIDGMYKVCVEQCFALYAIITHRLLKPTCTTSNNGKMIPDDISYLHLLEVIKLHKRTLRFNKSLQQSYSACFLMILLANVIEIPVGCNLILLTLRNDFMSCFRYLIIVATMFAHLLCVCWPGQRVIDHSSRLSFDAYCSEWYRFEKPSRTLLMIFMLRCTEPVCITAGGLVDINMENYASTVRVALSYTAAVSSFQ